MTVNVIVCTRNRRDRLETALQGFERLEIPAGVDWELMVIDNNSTDGTSEVIDDWERRGSLPLVRLVERRKGKSIALNSAIRNARGDIVAFTDDDCVVDPSWLRAIVREFEGDPSVAGVGGRVELYDPADHMVATRTERVPQVYNPIDRLALIFGCNMAFSQRALRAVGEFDRWLGPGSRCQSGEDLDLLYRAYKHGLKIIYVPEVLVYHNHGRRSYRDVRASFRAYGVSKGALYSKHLLSGDVRMARAGYRELWAAVRRSTRALVGRQPLSPTNIQPHDLLTGMLLYASLQLGSKMRSAWPSLRTG